MRIVVSCLCIVLAAGCGALKGKPAGATGLAALPHEVREYIDERWPGAQVEPPPAGTCPEASGAPTATVSGDFSGDGIPDLAIRVDATDGVHLVEAIARTDTHTMYTVPLEGDQAKGVLSVKKRGDKFVPESGVIDYLGLDTPVVTFCGSPATWYFWTGSGLAPRKIAATATQ